MNTVKDWDITLSDFETGGWGNAMNKFKAPRSIVRNFNDFITDQDIENCFGEAAIIMIQAIVKFKPVLRKLEFRWLKENTKDCLRKAVYIGVLKMMKNNDFWERTNSSNVSVTNFTMNLDTPSYLLNTDVFGTYMKPWIQNSNIDNYRVWEEDEYFQRTQNGNIEVIGKFDTDKFIELN